MALVGVNGAGKSTLSRILSGVEEPTSGTCQLGHQVVLDYYAQQQAERLQSHNTVYQEIISDAATAVVPQLRTLLGAFLFSGDAVEKRVAVLSGGEKSRLALAKMLLQASNTLILDEPTNHLDMRTKDIVKEALLQFGGTFVIVSHDRYFLNGLVTKVIELRDGHFTTYTGTFDEFLDWKERQKTQHTQPRSDTARLSACSGAGCAIFSSTEHRWHRRCTGCHSPSQARQIIVPRTKSRPGPSARSEPKRLAALEKSIAAFEAKKDQLEALLADENTFQHQDTARNVSAQYEQLKRQLEEAYLAWTALAEEYENE